MAGTNVAGGPPSVQESLRTMNQSMGQMMTFIQQNKQLQEMKTARETADLWSKAAPSMEQLVSNAESNNPILRMAIGKSFGLEGDEKGIDSIMKGYTNLSMLPEETGRKLFMDAGLEAKEGNYLPLRNMGLELSRGLGAEIPEITDNLGAFQPPARRTKTEGVVDLTGAQERIPSTPIEPESVVEPVTSLTPLERKEKAQLTQTETQKEIEAQTGRAAVEPRTEPPIGSMAWIEWKKELMRSGNQAAEEAKDTTSTEEETQKMHQQEQLFKLEEQKQQQRDVKRTEIDQQINQIDVQMNSTPRDNRNTPAFQRLQQTKTRLEQARGFLDRQSKLSPKTPVWFGVGRRMSEASGDVDSGTLSFVREREQVAMEAEKAKQTMDLSYGDDQFIKAEALRTLPDAKANGILGLLNDGPNAGSNSQGQRGTAAFKSIVRDTVTNEKITNLLGSMKEMDPLVMATYFPVQFETQLKMSDRDLRIAQLKINDKLANTQQYQVTANAYYQSLRDELEAGDPMAALILEKGTKQLDIISERLDWSDPKKAKIAWDEALKTNQTAGAAFSVMVEWFKAAGIAFTVESYRKDFLYRTKVNRLQVDVMQGMKGLDSETVTEGQEGAFDPNAAVSGLGF